MTESQRLCQRDQCHGHPTHQTRKRKKKEKSKQKTHIYSWKTYTNFRLIKTYLKGNLDKIERKMLTGLRFFFFCFMKSTRQKDDLKREACQL